MINQPKDWFEQAEYDYETALCMAHSERNIYAIFMCHLAIEKALKGHVHKLTEEHPPRIHSLIQLTKMAKLDPSKEFQHFLVGLDQASIPTRYPEDLMTAKKIYTKKRTEEILTKTKEVLEWLEKTS